MTMNGLYLNNELWNSYYPYQLPNVKDIFSEVYRISGGDINSLRKYSEFSYKTWKQMKSYLYTNNDLGLTPEEIQAERKRLLFNTDNSKSLSRIIKDLKASGFENSFISALDTKLGLYKDNPDLIQYRNSAGENFGEENLYAAFLDLFRAETPVLDGKYNTRQIASDLVLYAYLNGGIQEALQFVKYVPMSYLNLIPFAKNLKETPFVNTDVFGNIIGNVNPYISSKFTNQWIKHNGASLLKVDTDNIEIITGNKKKVNSIQEFKLKGVDLFVDRSEYSDHPIQPEAVSIYNSKIPTKYSVYKFDSSTYTYRRVNNLGYFNGIKEYDYQNNNQESVYNQNNTVSIVKNTSTVERKPVPERIDTPINDYLKFSKNKPNKKIITDALEIIASNSTNQYYNYLANQLLSTSNKLPDNIKIKLFEDPKKMGHYDYGTNTISINSDLSSSEDIEKAILHELIHGYSGNAAKVYDAFLEGKINSLGNISKAAQTTLKQLKILQNQYNNLVKNGGIYKYDVTEQEISNFEHLLSGKLSEFITVTLTDPDFQVILNKIKSDISPSFRKKFFNKIIKLLRELKILTQGDSILEDAVNLSLDLIKTTDPNVISLHSKDYLFSKQGINFLIDQEKELKLRNSDGSRKRFLKSKYKSLTLPKVQEINKQLKAERSSYKAKIITILGEKGDSRTYDAISLVPSDYNGVNRLNSRIKNEIC